MSLHHPIRFYPIFMFAILYSMTSSAYGAIVISLNSIGGIGNKVIVTMSMDNDSTLAGIQFTIRDTPNSLSLISITKTSRLSGFNTPQFNDHTDLGVATILGFTIGGPHIAPGSGDILILTYEISPNTPPGDITLTFDNISLSTPEAESLGATGVPDVITVLDPVALIPHPAGQSTNKFDQTAQAIDQDLFRFGIMNSAYSFRLSGLSFNVDFTQLSASDLTAVQLFEDTNGDGTPNGSSLFSNISINGSNITVNGLDILIPAETTRNYILRGTVGLGHVADRISMRILSEGVVLNIEGAVAGVIPIKVDSNLIDAVHTATGFTGDVSFDLSRNVIDVVKIIGVLLGNITMDGETSHYDINKDTLVDITDVVVLIQQILNGETQPS